MGLIAEIHRDLEKGALQLLVEYRERLLHEAVKLCGDASQAEDLVFRTIERVLQKSETYRSDDNLRTRPCFCRSAGMLETPCSTFIAMT